MTVLDGKAYVHGITPFYYLQFDTITMLEFNKILSMTNIQVAKPFMDSVIEIYELVNKVYKNQDLDGIPEDVAEVMMDRVTAEFLIGLYKENLSIGASTLREIRDDNLIKYDVDHDLKLGRLSLNELLAFNDQVIDEKLDQELRRYAVLEVNGEYQGLQQVLDDLEILSNNLATAIGLVQKRIERIASQTGKPMGHSLQSSINMIGEAVAKIDSYMLGEDRFGTFNKRQYEMTIYLRKNMETIGINGSTQKYAKFMDNKSHILALDKKSYNQKLIPRYETKKQVLEKYLRDVSTTIDLLKSEYQVPLFFF